MLYFKFTVDALQDSCSGAGEPPEHVKFNVIYSVLRTPLVSTIVCSSTLDVLSQHPSHLKLIPTDASTNIDSHHQQLSPPTPPPAQQPQPEFAPRQRSDDKVNRG